MNIELINKLFKKNPSILKSIKGYNEKIPEDKLLYLHHLVQEHNHVLKKVKLVYSQYKNFQELYDAIIQVTGQCKDGEKLYFDKQLFLNKLKKNNIEYKTHNSNLVIIIIKKYEELKEYGSKKWCIYKSESTFNSYIKNGERQQYIILDFNNKKNNKFKIGVTSSNDYFSAFDDGNKSISIEYLGNMIPLNEKLGIQKDNNGSNNNNYSGGISLLEALLLFGFFAALMTQATHMLKENKEAQMLQNDKIHIMKNNEGE
jgi:hypothetical protein